MKMKKAMTLLEITMAVIAASVIMYLSAQSYKSTDWLNSVNKLTDDIVNILDKGVMNNVTGYINSSGDPCSNSFHYTDISAARVVECNNWNNVFPYEGTNTKIGKDSYITKLLKNHTANGDGCKMYIDDKDSSSFYFFVDCSNLNYDNGSQKYKKYVEQKILSKTKDSFSTLFQSADLLSTAIDNNTGGTEYDGRIRILIKK